MSDSSINRRKFLKNAAALSSVALLPSALWADTFKIAAPAPVPGINLGVITYSFRSMPGKLDDLLGYLVELGLNSVELMGEPAEEYAGAPPFPGWGRTPEKRKELEAWSKEMKKFRASADIGKFKEIKKRFKKEGIKVEVIKFGAMARMSEEEIDYCFKAAKAVGAKGITLERSDESIEKLSPYATQYKRQIGYHNHAKVAFDSWDEAVKKSPYNSLNLDVGHYIAGTNTSPIPLIEKYHDRILNLHLKDRKFDEGPNMPWGQGDTPLKEILQLMKKNKYKFMGTIELEYDIPEGSNAVKEVKNCIEFCREAVG
jgi:sugar phosphate isomerase/epimerase